MFKQARIRLTIFYSVAVMSVSLIFSFFIYQSVSLEFERGFRRVAMTAQADQLKISLPASPPPRFIQMHPQLFNQNLPPDMLENIAQIKRRFVGWLFLINSIIFIISLTLGYLVAGKNLAPLQKAHDSQKRFVADASHELKTPLSVMKTSIEVLKRRKVSTKNDWQNLADSMLVEVNSLQKLTEDLLSLTGAGQQMEKISNINLAKSIDIAVERIKPLADEKKIKVKLALKNISIKGQAQSLEQLWMILLDNAIKYSDEKSEVRVLVKKVKNKVHIEISDQGMGINEKDLEMIFDRFYRLDTARSKKGVAGFGLGLAIAKQIVEQNSGQITVKSKVSQGSSFIVILPLS